MQETYFLQHEILKNIIFNEDSALQNCLNNKDESLAKQLILIALSFTKIPLLYDFKCEFDNIDDIPILIYQISHKLYEPSISDCKYIVIGKINKKTRYFTAEYSFDNELVLCEWQNKIHLNYGPIQGQDKDCVLSKIKKLIN